jgi:peroxiredoxin
MKKTFVILVSFFCISITWGQSGQQTFKEKLDTFRAKMQRGMPPAAWEQGERIGNNMTDSVVARGGMYKVLKPGSKIPSFKLNDVNGVEIDFNQLLKKGPVVLVFYRGAWCPFCNLYLNAIQEKLPEIESMGAQLVGFTSAKADMTFEKTKLKYPVLADVQNKVAKQFGLSYELTEEIDKYYKNFGKDFSKDHNTEKSELLMSAVYIIDKKGIVRYQKAEAAYKNWAEPAEILAVLKALK